MPLPEHRLAFESFGLCAEIVSDDLLLLERLAAALPPGWVAADEAPAAARFGLMRDGSMIIAGERAARAADAGAGVDALESAIRLHIALHAPAFVFIHAGVVGIGGRAIVIPGASMSGKSTLVAELVRAGAVYYSDEYAPVSADGLVHPYPRELTLRYDPGSGRAGVKLPVPRDQLGRAPIPGGLVLITSHKFGTPWQPVACQPGEGALALLEHTIPARTRSAQALSTIRRLVQHARVISGTRGDARQVAEALLSTDLTLLVGCPHEFRPEADRPQRGRADRGAR